MAGVAVVIFVFCSLAIICMFDRYRIRSPYSRPVISDDEFMDLLPPGTNRDVAMRVRSIVSEQSGIERDLIHPDSTFIELFE